MASILIAYATSEGHTADIAAALARQLEAASHWVVVEQLDQQAPLPGIEGYDAVVLAASVHAGNHQAIAEAFVQERGLARAPVLTALVSVGLASAATTEAGRNRARQQVDEFTRATGWQPDLVHCAAGAWHPNRGARWRGALQRGVLRLAQRALQREGWPDLTGEGEWTDWRALAAFAGELSARLDAQAYAAADS